MEHLKTKLQLKKQVKHLQGLRYKVRNSGAGSERAEAQIHKTGKITMVKGKAKARSKNKGRNIRLETKHVTRCKTRIKSTRLESRIRTDNLVGAW